MLSAALAIAIAVQLSVSVMWSIEGARDRLEPVPKHSHALFFL